MSVHWGVHGSGSWGSPEKRKCALFLVICSPSVPLLYLSQILQLPQRGKPTFTVTSARGNQPSWQLCVPAERCLWQPSDQRVRSARWQEGRRHPCKGRCPFQECRPPLHHHNQHHGPRQPALYQCLSCCRTKGWGTGTLLLSPLHTAGVELNGSENQSCARRRSASRPTKQSLFWIYRASRAPHSQVLVVYSANSMHLGETCQLTGFRGEPRNTCFS